MTYDEMLCYADNNDIEIIEVPFKGKAKGYHIENVIFINQRLSYYDKRCTLAEELAHYKYSSGNILDLKDISSIKCELLARNHSYRSLVKLLDIIRAFNSGVRNRYELAEFLDVTEEFLDEAINYYKNKYENKFIIDNYMITFSPLSVLKMY